MPKYKLGNYKHVDSSARWNSNKVAFGVTTDADRAAIVKLNLQTGVADPIELLPIDTAANMAKSSNLQVVSSGNLVVATWDEENSTGAKRQSRCMMWDMTSGMQKFATPVKITQGNKDQFSARPVILDNGEVAILSAQGDLGSHGYRVDIFSQSGFHQRAVTLDAPSFMQILHPTGTIDGVQLGSNLLVVREDIFSTPANALEITREILRISDLVEQVPEDIVSGDQKGNHDQPHLAKSKGVALAAYVDDASMGGDTGNTGKDVKLRVARSDGTLGTEITVAGQMGDQDQAKLAAERECEVVTYIDHVDNKVKGFEIAQQANGDVSSSASLTALADINPTTAADTTGGNTVSVVNGNVVTGFISTTGELNVNVARCSAAPATTATPSTAATTASTSTTTTTTLATPGAATTAAPTPATSVNVRASTLATTAANPVTTKLSSSTSATGQATTKSQVESSLPPLVSMSTGSNSLSSQQLESTLDALTTLMRFTGQLPSDNTAGLSGLTDGATSSSLPGSPSFSGSTSFNPGMVPMGTALFPALYYALGGVGLCIFCTCLALLMYKRSRQSEQASNLENGQQLDVIRNDKNANNANKEPIYDSVPPEPNRASQEYGNVLGSRGDSDYVGVRGSIMAGGNDSDQPPSLPATLDAPSVPSQQSRAKDTPYSSMPPQPVYDRPFKTDVIIRPASDDQEKRSRSEGGRRRKHSRSHSSRSLRRSHSSGVGSGGRSQRPRQHSGRDEQLSAADLYAAGVGQSGGASYSNLTQAMKDNPGIGKREEEKRSRSSSSRSPKGRGRQHSHRQSASSPRRRHHSDRADANSSRVADTTQSIVNWRRKANAPGVQDTMDIAKLPVDENKPAY